MATEEEEIYEHEESGHSDDDEDVDDIKHAALPKVAVRPTRLLEFIMNR